MSDISKLFWSASVEEIKKGYVYDRETDEFTCLICGNSFLKGVIYAADNVFYEAEKFTQLHIASEHSSMFEYLVGLDKKITGLTDLQSRLLQFFYQGLSDNEIVKEMDGGSSSTIRNHRFTMREKMKQAKVFLTIMELVEEKSDQPKFINMHRTATMIDHRYAITEEENDKILKSYFKNGLNGPLSEFPKKEKRRVAILKHLAKSFDANKEYNEKEVNEILKKVYADYVVLRRNLVDYGFLDRYPDGSKYWVKQ